MLTDGRQHYVDGTFFPPNTIELDVLTDQWR